MRIPYSYTISLNTLDVRIFDHSIIRVHDIVKKAIKRQQPCDRLTTIEINVGDRLSSCYLDFDQCDDYKVTINTSSKRGQLDKLTVINRQSNCKLNMRHGYNRYLDIDSGNTEWHIVSRLTTPEHSLIHVLKQIDRYVTHLMTDVSLNSIIQYVVNMNELKDLWVSQYQLTPEIKQLFIALAKRSSFQSFRYLHIEHDPYQVSHLINASVCATLISEQFKLNKALAKALML